MATVKDKIKLMYIIPYLKRKATGINLWRSLKKFTLINGFNRKNINFEYISIISYKKSYENMPIAFLSPMRLGKINDISKNNK